MIIYKDLFTGDEMLSDTYKMKLRDDIFYEVEGKMTTEKTEITDAMIGGNASAEEPAAEACEDGSASGVDIVLANRLQQTAYSKKDYGTYIKGYMKKILAKLEKENPERAAAFKAAAQPAIKKVLETFKDWDFYQGESQNDEGMVALLNFREDGVTPYMLFFRDGLIEEKV